MLTRQSIFLRKWKWMVLPPMHIPSMHLF
uniref:Uncharacterized protein n=1 Tax=Arundo donax TaxID=35708 RepID=A0A0A8Y0V2_ARUDO